MALSVPKAPGVSQMLKDGARVSATRRNNSARSPPGIGFIEIRLKRKHAVLRRRVISHRHGTGLDI